MLISSRRKLVGPLYHQVSFVRMDEHGKTYNDQRSLLLLLFGIVPSCTAEEHFAETGLNFLADSHGLPFGEVPGDIDGSLVVCCFETLLRRWLLKIL